MSVEELQTPLTAVEMAQLQAACGKALTPAGVMLLRRAFWELDTLRRKVTSYLGFEARMSIDKAHDEANIIASEEEEQA